MFDMYRENILDHAQNPRNHGLLDSPDIDHEEDNPLCGDHLHLTVRLDDNDRIVAVGWDGDGCAISQASASMLGEEILGKTLDEVKALSKDNIFEMLGIELSMNRVKCALLSLKVLKVGAYGLTEWQKAEDAEEE
jgi:nitrogen fixation NifU-like protein